jgi:hypothetical protein
MSSTKIFLLIQGHTNFCNEVLDSVKNIDNVIWSTDDDAETSHLEIIKNSNVKLVTSKKPDIPGYGNVNLQLNSTREGLLHAKKLGADYVIKMRSDMVFSDTKKFIDTLNLDDKLYFLAYVNNLKSGNLPREKNEIDNWIREKNLNIENLKGYNYVLDFINYGKINRMLSFWSYPLEDSIIPVPLEHKLLVWDLKNNQKRLDFSFEYLSKIYGFFLSNLQKNKISLNTLKWVYDYSTLNTGASEGGFLS